MAETPKDDGQRRSDTEMLDWLQQQLLYGRYTGRCIFRISGYGRGIRLHETSVPGAVDNVREAIYQAMLAAEKQEKSGG